MLTLTENASAIVNEITPQPGLTETAGLRITSDQGPEPAFAISAAPQAEPGDQVVEQAGATVYLDPSAATAPRRQGPRRRGRPERARSSSRSPSNPDTLPDESAQSSGPAPTRHLRGSTA